MNFANLAAQASALADTMVSLAHARKRCSPDEANGCGSGAKEKTHRNIEMFRPSGVHALPAIGSA
jgi:hypothetical protein